VKPENNQWKHKNEREEYDESKENKKNNKEANKPKSMGCLTCSAFFNVFG